jgi:hypothetical protein
MALKTDIRGMVWKYPEPFVVGREQIRQYANSVKACDPASVDPAAAAKLGYDGLVAPLTFVSIIAVMTQRHFFQQEREAKGHKAHHGGDQGIAAG